MIIEKQENGWSFTDETHTGLWCLVYTDNKIIAVFSRLEAPISTSVNLFVGSQEECEQHTIDNELVYENITTNIVMPDDIVYEITSEGIDDVGNTLAELNSPDTVPNIEEVINI